MRNLLKAVALFAVGSILLACTQAPSQIHISGRTMGTTYNIKFVSIDDELSPQQLKQQIDQALELVNDQMSTYREHSELSRLNQNKSSNAMQVSADLNVVLQEAVRLGKMSDGYLDVTVGPLVNLWGFGPQAQPEKIPQQALIESVKAKTGLKYLDVQNNSVSKSNPELYVDLSTIAKGFGVDQVANILEAKGINNYLVEIGGEMRLAGHKAGGQAWVVAIEKPITTERAAQRFISVGNNAVATAGDYRNYYERDGVRYSHLINPKTGYPIQHNLVSVTVVHPSSMTADGLATAINVMGPEKGLVMANANKLAVLLITKENGEFKEYTSQEFEPFLK